MDRFEYHVNNLIPMPEHRCPDDDKWIREMLSQLPIHVCKRAVVGYEEVFLQSYNDEQISYKRENAARKAANLRLREFVKKFKYVTTAEVSKPPIYKAA